MTTTKIFKDRVRVKENAAGVTHIDIEGYYSLGGYNYFTYRQERRGYYVSVQPVTVGNNCVSFTGFTGLKECIIPCDRQSKKNAAALESMDKSRYSRLIQTVLDKNGLELDE